MAQTWWDHCWALSEAMLRIQAFFQKLCSGYGAGRTKIRGNYVLNLLELTFIPTLLIAFWSLILDIKVWSWYNLLS